MKKVFLLSFGFVFLFVLASFAADAPETITLKAKNGDVNLPHKTHTETLKVTCVTCHHTTKEGQAVDKCSKCHGADPKALAAKDAFHKLCQDCHKQKNEKEGKKAPTKCMECHKKK